VKALAVDAAAGLLEEPRVHAELVGDNEPSYPA
jgi:hypothetical protein